MQTVTKLTITLILIVVTLLLTACSSSSTEPQTGTASKDTPVYDLGGDPLQYEGSVQQASLTPQNAYEFLEITFLFAGSVSGNDICTSGEISNPTGELDANGNGSLLLEYTDCLLGGVTINGRMLAQVKDYGTEVTILFNALTFTDDTGAITRFSGSILQSAPSDCSSYSETYNIVVNEVGTGNYYQMQDLRLTRSIPCDVASPETVIGRIYISDYGYVDASTMAPYLYTSNSNPFYVETYFPDRAGHIHLAGANGTSADFQLNVDKVYKQSVINHELVWVQFSVDADGDGKPDNTTRLTVSQFEAGAAKDLRDSDDDGIINSWEMLYGLNPNDAEDASLDNDADGYSNLDEYLQFGDPANAADVPRVTDLSITFSNSIMGIRAGQKFYVGFAVINPNPVYGAENVVVSLVKPPSVSWVTPFICTPVGEDEMLCNLSDISQASTIGLNLPVVSDQPGDLVFSASVVSDTYDSKLINNSAQVTTTINQRSLNLGIEFTGYKENEYAIIGETSAYQMLITQWGDEARNTVLTMNIPADISITSANYTIADSPARTGSCSIGVNLVCSLGTIPNNEASYKATIDITVTGISEGLVTQTASIGSDGIDSDPSDNQSDFTTFVGKSLAPIQSVINSASPGDTVTIPDGLYVGTLSLTSGNITVTSANGPQSTSVWLSDIAWMGPSTSIHNITFTGRSYLGGMLGADLDISGNIFTGLDNAIEGASVSGNIYNNRFTGARYGAKSITSSCTQVLINGNSSVHIYNNIFDNNSSSWLFDCRCVWVDGTSFNGQSTEIINNTFVGNDTAVMISNPYDALTNINVMNNLMQANELAVTASSVFTGSYEPSVFNNLSYQNGLDYEGISPGQLVDNIIGDPLLVDPANGDFRLSAGSIAIDAGVDASAPLSDYYGSSRPIDGDNDGTPTTDIGAHEFNPN